MAKILRAYGAIVNHIAKFLRAYGAFLCNHSELKNGVEPSNGHAPVIEC